jgi:hypothetical protein
LIKKKRRVRRGIIAGNSKTLWDAVLIFKNKNNEKIQQIMFLHNKEVKTEDLQDAFTN